MANLVNRHLLIDADILVYRIGAAHQRATLWDEDLWSLTARFDPARAELEAFLDQLKADLGATKVSLFLSPSTPSFRAEVFSRYKGNRKGVMRPLLYRPLREHMVNELGAIVEPPLEGDDLLGLRLTEDVGDDEERVCCSIDKDMRTVPGKHYNWDTGEVLGVETVTEEQAIRFFLSQVLTGDTVDGYPGCPGIGPVKAGRILDGAGDDPEDQWAAVVKTFAWKYGKEAEAVALGQARCAWILRGNDYDNESKEIRLWTPDRIRV